MSDRPPLIAIATNNGDIGGGEVMLLNIAEALRAIGLRVLVIGPSGPADLVTATRERGFDVEALPAHGRAAWMRALLRWRLRNRHIPLWCNGLVPSLATVGLGPRIVHFHMVPTGMHGIAARIARLGVRRTLAISRYMQQRVPGSTLVENWTAEIIPVPKRVHSGPVRIGFIGRLTRDKGVHVLAQAVQMLRADGRDVVLVLAGEARHASMEDRQLIEAAVEPLGAAVERHGWMDRGEFFSSIDVAAFPSTWLEHFGLVAAEAMAAEVPFVITDSGALPEVVGGGYPWIARRSDPHDLARVLREVIDRRGADTAPITASARARWQEQYSPEAGQSRVAQLLISMAHATATSTTVRGGLDVHRR